MKLARIISLFLIALIISECAVSCAKKDDTEIITETETYPQTGSETDSETDPETETLETESLLHIYINEVCASNNSCYSDGTEENNYYDWIEIYNAEDFSVNLEGYSLSDSASELRKFVFPSAEIGAGEYMIIFACGEEKSGEALYADFKISASGETLYLADPDRKIIDTVKVPALDTDTVYGRIMDGGSELSRMTPTPKASNDGAQRIPEPVQVPVLSKKSGFYSSEISLEISVPQGCTVYYTLDGNTPDKTSEEYSEPLSIGDASKNRNYYSMIGGTSALSDYKPNYLVTKGTVVRAVAYSEDGRYSDVVTATYFVDLNDEIGLKDIPIVSLTTDEANLFDSTYGIYMKGDIYNEWRATLTDEEYNALHYWLHHANYYMSGKEWERPATIEYFNSDHEFVFVQDVGIRIHGGASRSYLQKSFNVYARNEYSGDNEFPIAMFENVPYTSAFMLRNGGNDTNEMKFRDLIIQSLAADTNATYQQAYPCVVFLNGEYWGVYCLQEKYTDRYFEQHYGVDPDEVTVLKIVKDMADDAEGLEEYRKMYSYIGSRNMEKDIYYDRVCGIIDIDSFIDYMCVEMIIANNDWPHNNYLVWKVNTVDESNPYADGRWRWALFDTEGGAASSGYSTSNVDCFAYANNNKIFTSLMKNDKFRQKFVMRMMDLINENYSYDKASDAADEYYNRYKFAMADFYHRFVNESYDIATYRSEISVFRRFFRNRADTVEKNLDSHCKLESAFDVELNVSEVGAGYIKINSIEPQKIKDGEKWTGRYFSDYPITLTAEAQEGYVFVGWSVSGATIVQGTESDETISLKLQGNTTVTAEYVGRE